MAEQWHIQVIFMSYVTCLDWRIYWHRGQSAYIPLGPQDYSFVSTQSVLPALVFQTLFIIYI